MRLLLVLCVMCVCDVALGQSECSVIIPYPSMVHLTSAELNLYKLSDPCSVRCKPGYSGDACVLVPNVSSVPQGPWNVAGYYTSAEGGLKKMALSLTNSYSSVSFTGSDNTLVGLFNNQLASSKVNLISLSSQTVTTILSLQYLDALQVRYGMIFVAKAVSLSGPFDISVLSGPPYSLVPFMNISLRAANIEIFQDKGMNTSFVFSTASSTRYQLRACYPNGTCNLWYTATSPISSMVCGADCPNSLYVALLKSVYQVSRTGATLLVTSAKLVNCMASSPGINTILYRTGTSVVQMSLGANGTHLIYPNVMTTDSALELCSGTCCSLDISESNALIMLVEDGMISMVESMQMPCPSWYTSAPVVSTSMSDCYPCPNAPENGYLVPGSSMCAWRCQAGFTQVGSQCVSLRPAPCPRYYYDAGGDCLPSGMPWAPEGHYRLRVNASEIGYALPPSTTNVGYVFGAGVIVQPPYVASPGNKVSFSAMTQTLYGSLADSNVWQVMTVNLSVSAKSKCGYNRNNELYYLMQQDGILWVGFYMRTGLGLAFQEHCLWGLDVSKSSQNITQAVRVSTYWSVAGAVCSATGDEAGNAYVIQCGTNFISMAPAGGGMLKVVAGQSNRGYQDGDLLSGRMSSPSSVVYYKNRLFVADTGNCVLREVDLIRGRMSTVAGLKGVCERMDGGVLGARAGLVYPTNLTLTSAPGFFLFTDQGRNEDVATIRQYHADSGTVTTIQTSIIRGVTALASMGDRVYVHAQSTGAFYKAVAVASAQSQSATPGPGGAGTVTGRCTAVLVLRRRILRGRGRKATRLG
jgi:hypothetical protein